eukprot:TRINITY_DN400_c4_g1_i2.p2 TRINITY_DN400_c4_g1~~TRINITY_DN400_c4_g1_i2.p2  ORF type:complete len:263 (+),score=62.68 TRINITY_DN400_c4_g1_i2:112-900(+)
MQRERLAAASPVKKPRRDHSGSQEAAAATLATTSATCAFVGLRNQGATCYLNSLLQSLYHLSAFRQAVYNVPTEHEPPVASVASTQTSIALALQRVFYQLQFGTSSSAVSTQPLTRSFGWEARDAFVQHDVQELSRVLIDALASSQLAADGTVERLFAGKMESRVECPRVSFKSTRIETFCDLSLTVKGCRDLIESLDQFVQPEHLVGENRYAAEGYGLQDAVKTCRFVTLPPGGLFQDRGIMQCCALTPSSNVAVSVHCSF